MVDTKLAIRELAKELRNLDDTLHAVGEVAESKGLSNRKRRAILTAIKALSFACCTFQNNIITTPQVSPASG